MRRGRHRDGPVVDPCRGVAAFARRLWVERAQPHFRYRNTSTGGGPVYRIPGGERCDAGPELFPRSNGTTYVCAISSESPLPIDPAEVSPDPGAIERLERLCVDLSPVLASAKILARQACFRPVTRDGLPLIGRI